MAITQRKIAKRNTITPLSTYARYILIWAILLFSWVSIAGIIATIQDKKLFDEIIKQYLPAVTNQSNITLEVSPEPQSSTVILWWDIMLSRWIWYWNKKEWRERTFSWDNYHPIKEIPACEDKRCLLLFNLESPFSEKDNDIAEPTFWFRANTGHIWLLSEFRAENTMLVSLANNHINNARWAWLLTTRATLEEFGFYHVWAWTSEQEARRVRTFQHQDINRCISAYSYDWNWWIYGWNPLYRNKVHLTWMLEDLNTMKTQHKCDVKAMMLHRWTEYRKEPNKWQVNIAHTLIDNGVDLIIWWHSHIPWRIEQYSGKYIFYSLGNTLFDQDRWMQAVGQGMDTIYDHELGKDTVPTYISLLPELRIQKSDDTTSIFLETIHGTKVKKWIFYPLDEKTKVEVIAGIYSWGLH